MDHVLGRNGPRFRDVTSHFGIPSVAGRGERKGVHHHVIYMFTTILRPSYDHPTTIPVSAVFFFIFDRRQKSLRALLSLSHTHTHTHASATFHIFPYITYNVRFKRNPKYSGTKTTRTIITPKIWQKHVDFNLFIIIFFFKFVACAVPTDKSHGRQMLNGYKACSLYESGSSRSLIYMHYHDCVYSAFQ